MKFRNLLCGAAFVAMAGAQPVMAQEAAPEAEASGLDEIVVTAQRRAENLQKVGVAVSAVTGDDLVNAGISDTTGLARMVPSLVVQPVAGTGLNLYLRGVGTLQGNAYGENPIALNFGGVYIARPSSLSGMFYDLERVEVVKGPQGTLYGRNATGGAINVLPRKPRLGEVGGDAMFEYGNYNSIKAAGAVNLPIGDTVALRVAGQVVDRDGYLSDGYQDDVGQAARASLLIEPNNQWSMLLVADYYHQGGKGGGGVLAPGAAFPAGFNGFAAPAPSDRIGGSDPRSVAALSAYAATLFAPPFCGGLGGFITSGCVLAPRNNGYIDANFYGISATVEGDVGFGTLTVAPAYRLSKNKFLSYLPGFLIDTDETNKQMSLEVRLASNGDGPLKYVVGGYYFHEDQDARNFFAQGTLVTTRLVPQLKTTSLAGFGQLTFDVTDAIRLVAGGRYTKEDRTQSTLLASGGLPGVVEPALGAPIPGSLDFERFTWKLGIEADLGAASLLYANVATGFKAGGFFAAAPPNNTYAPEKLTAYTIGSKNRFLNDRLQLNVEAFYWDYKDQQISFVGPVQTPTSIVSGGTTVNAGQARMYGFDASMLFEVVPNGILSADVQYLNGKYNTLNFTAISASGGAIRNGCSITNSRLANPGTPNPARLFDINCSGQPTINSPEWSANLGYEHTIPMGDMNLIVNGRTRVETSRFVNIDFLPEQRQGSYMTSDASITLEGPNKRWSLTGFVNNIENETIISGAFTKPVLQTVYTTLRPPRTYGIRAAVNF